MTNDYTHVPAELKKLRQWGLYTREFDINKYKFNKIPILGVSNDPNSWIDFDSALEKLNAGEGDGLAFFLKKPYILIDIDHVENQMEQTLAGDPENEVADFVEHTNSYTEKSMSGSGIHIIIKGKMKSGKRHRNVEIYPNGRFVALTGIPFGKPKETVAEISDENMKYLLDNYIDTASKDTFEVPEEPEPATDGTNVILTKEEVINKALASASGPKFKAFMDGNWQSMGYDSQSEADQGFANMLAFWCAKDRALMDDIFRSSGMYRTKWDQKRGKGTYADLTLNEAINKTYNVYQPHTDDNFSITIKDQSSTIDKKKLDPLLRDMSYTDTGLRNRFLQKHINDVKYSAERKKFLIFDGKKWEYDIDGKVPRMLEPVVMSIQGENLGTDNPDEDSKKAEAREKSKQAFIKRSKSNNGKTAALNEIKKYVKTSDESFDNQLGIINTPSGIINLSTGEVRQAEPSDLVTKITGAGVEKMDTPIFDKFMNDIFPDYPELKKTVLLLAGYQLLGTVAEQKSVILYGQGSNNGANGKSVLVELLRELLGDYATGIDPEVITSNRKSFGDSNKDSQIANTKGARMIVTSELERGAILSESLLKRLTGGEKIQARRLYELPFSFKPTGTLWMTTNYKPIVAGTDNGIWRRLVFIPMTAKITQRDPHLLDKLLTEKEGIMYKLIQSALYYQQHGLEIPKICQETSGEYRDEMDTVGTFLTDCFVVDNNSKTTTHEIYQIFDDWERVYRTGLTHRGLSRELGQRFKRYRTESERGYLGLKPKDNHASNEHKYGKIIDIDTRR